LTSDSLARVLAREGEDALFEAAFRTGAFDAASRRLQEALEASQSSGDTSTEAFVIDRLGMVAHYRNIMRLIDGEDIVEADTAAEEALFRRALELRQALGDVAGAAQSLFGIGLVHQVLRADWPTAMGYYTQASSLAGEAGTALDPYSRSEIHRHLGFYFLVHEVDSQKAIDHLRISLELREQLGDERLLPSALVALGQAEAAAGNRRHAIEILERAVTCARSARLSASWLDDAEQALADTLGGPRE
jgi:tetratricopeptide (TPR) repeat protein